MAFARSITIFGLLAGLLSSQELSVFRPRGAAPGEELEVLCLGRGLSDLVGAITFASGIEVLAATAERDDRATLKLRIAADCPLGTHLLQLRTRRGLARAKAFSIGPLPTHKEGREPHASFESAQLVPFDTTIDGRILPEDQDWYAFDVAAGQRVVLELEGVRLGDGDWDPCLEVFAQDGTSVLQADDSDFGGLDPLAQFAAQSDGRYRVLVRDLAGRGAQNASYRLHLGGFPRPTLAYPPALACGTSQDPDWLQDGEPRRASITAPGKPGPFGAFPVIDGRVPPTAIAMLADDRPCFVEAALPAAAPSPGCAFHGVIAVEGESDRFAFRASRGDRFELRVLARTLRSPLDPVLVVRDAAGKELAANDDANGLDARVRFSAPADGEFSVVVSDQLGRGGAGFIYRVELDAPGDGANRVLRTSESIPGVRAEDFGVAVPQGGRNATLLALDGADAKDALQLALANLPGGVRATFAGWREGLTVLPLVLEADPGSALAASLATPTARTGAEARERPVEHRHVFPLLRVRNDQVLIQHRIDALPVAVVESCPFGLDVMAPAVPMVQGGSAALALRVTRVAEFGAPIEVRVLGAPPGLSFGTATLRDAQLEATIPISARGNAATGRFPLVLVARATVDGVARTVSSALVELEVQEPWLDAKLARARIEQGGEGSLQVELEMRRAFEGTLVAELGRLPSGVEADVPPITATSSRIAIPLRATQDAAAGRHRSISLRVRVQTPKGEVVHSFGGGELRVDKPIPKRAGGGQDG